MKKLLSVLFVFSLFVGFSQQRLTGSINFDKQIIHNSVASTVASTGSTTLTTTQIANGLIVAPTATATSTFVLPTATSLANDLEMAAGSYIDFFVLNNGASNGTVTISVGTGITASGFPSSNTLTLAGSSTVGIAGFRITFLSGTAATLTRIN